MVSPNVTTTPGYELSTWILRQVTTPALHTAEIAAIVFGNGFIRVIERNKNVEVSNVVRRAAKKCIIDKKGSESPLKRCTPSNK